MLREDDDAIVPGGAGAGGVGWGGEAEGGEEEDGASGAGAGEEWVRHGGLRSGHGIE